MDSLKIKFVFYVSFISLIDTSALPNIVIFMADDLGIGDVGIFGNTTLRTPNIDRIGHEGVKLSHHLAADSVCTPSRAAFLTGRYPIRTGLGGPRRVIPDLAVTTGLPPEEITLAEQAKKAGYHTAIIGKWHLGLFDKWRNPIYHPMNQGFDEFYGLPLSNLYDTELAFYDYKSHRYSPAGTFLPQIIAVYLCTVVPLWLFFYKTKLVSRSLLNIFVTIGTILYCLHYLNLYHMCAFNSVLMRGYNVIEQPIHIKGLTKRFVEESIKVLEQSASRDQPVMLFVSWHLTHTSLQPMDKFKGKSSHGKYGDCVEEMDWGVGEIMSALGRLDITNNTIVYFTSDHGGHIEENSDSNGGYNGIYRGGKTWGAVEGGIRVPGLIKWPGKLPVKHVVQEPTSMMDIFPTLSDIMGVALPTDRPIDGRNIKPLLIDNSSTSPHKFLMHYCSTEIQAVTYRPLKNDNRIWKVAFKFPDMSLDSSDCVNVYPYINRICSCSFSKLQSPPLLFDLTSDPGESAPIDVNASDIYQNIIQIVTNAVNEHEATLGTIDSKLTGSSVVWSPHLQPCCNFPLCSCSEGTIYNNKE